MRKHYILYIITAVALCAFVIVFVGCDNHNDVSNTELQGADIESTVFKITGNELYTKVSNSTQTFAFSTAINVAQNATFTVSTDNKGECVIRSKTVELEVGDNTYYIIVENGKDAAIYVVTIRRKPVYVVNFVGDKNTVLSKQIEEDDKVTEPTEVSIKGYEFNGWTFDFTTPITCNTTIYANLDKPIVYKTYYDLNDEKFVYKVQNNNNLQECTIKDTPKTPSAKGYLFKGWTSFFDDVKKIAYFSALWEPIKYNITYDFNDEKSVSKVLAKNNYPKYYTVESEIVFKDPERKGYNLVSWNAHTIKKGSIGDIHIVAEWEAIEYSITYLLNDENLSAVAVNSGNNPSTYTIEDEINIDYPTCVGYSFFGWYMNDERGKYVAKIYKGDAQNYTLCAIWGTQGISIKNGHVDFSGNKKNIIIPSRDFGQSVTNILASAFATCSWLTTITIPNSVTSIGNSAFYNCDELKDIHIKDISAWCNISGLDNLMKYGSSNKRLYINNELVTSLTIGDGCMSVPSYAFNNCGGLTEVTISGNVNSIGDYAFYNCNGLTRVIIGNSVASIGEYAFYDCNILQNICINDISAWCKVVGLKNLMYYGSDTKILYLNNEQVAELTITDGVSSIPSYAFTNCVGLTNITIPNGVANIGSFAFYNCYDLASVTIPESVMQIGESAFKECNALMGVFIADVATWCAIRFEDLTSNPLYIAHKCYLNGRDIETLLIPDGVTSIGDYAFANCTDFTRVTIPDSVKSIGNFAFYNCSGLTSVTIGNDVTGIGDSAFFGCSGLTSITIPNSVTRIGCGAFRDCNGLTNITLPFVGASKKASDGYDQVFFYIFGYTTTRSSDYVAGATYQYDDNSGYYYYYIPSSIKSVTIAGEKISISSYAFYNCDNLIEITIQMARRVLMDMLFMGVAD